MNIVTLERAYNAILFSHLNTLLFVPLLFLMIFRDILLWSIIAVINFDANLNHNGNIILNNIRILTWWHNSKVAFFVATYNSILCLRAINPLHDRPLVRQRFGRIKEDSPQYPTLSHEHKNTRQITQHKVICNGRKDTRVLPPPSFTSKLLLLSPTKI